MADADNEALVERVARAIYECEPLEYEPETSLTVHAKRVPWEDIRHPQGFPATYEMMCEQARAAIAAHDSTLRQQLAADAAQAMAEALRKAIDLLWEHCEGLAPRIEPLEDALATYEATRAAPGQERG